MTELNVQEMKTINGGGKNSAMCSAVMGGAGLAHTTLYGVAASALGVSGPAGWVVGAAIGGAYYAGSLLC
ncbi:hypothetical protein VBH15_03545 [Vagococcus fluvialis]